MTATLDEQNRRLAMLAALREGLISSMTWEANGAESGPWTWLQPGDVRR